MADEADITTARDEVEYASRLAASRMGEGPVAIGSCHYCDDPVAEGVRFCCADCRDEYTEEQRLKAIGGLQ